jgi:uncharacterized protein (TIGR03435 family)
VYALVVGKSRPKLKEADPARPGRGARINGKETLRGWTTAHLADVLSITTQQTDRRSVVDRTGLKGVYEFDLEFDPNPNPLAHHEQPDVCIAVQEQLGLKLEERKEAFDIIIVVDHMEKPSAN